MNENEQAIKAIEDALRSVDVKNADITSSSGVAGVDLLPVSNIVTLVTPFTNMVPREGAGATGPAALFDIIKGDISGDVSGTAEEGKRGGAATFSGTRSGSYYKTSYLEIGVTDEAQYTAEGKLDMRNAAIARTLVESKRIQERRMLFGRTTKASDTYAAGRLTTTADGASVSATPTPTLVSTTGGAIADGTYSVIAVALNGDAYWATKGYTVSAAGTFAATAGSELLDRTRTNGDGTTTTVKGGTGIKSSAASSGALSTTNANKITATLAAVSGAIGYAWFVGTSGSEVFQGVTSRATAVFTKLQTGTQVAASVFTADNSADSLVYDGILTRIEKAGLNISSLANGATLTADGQGGILEFSDIFSNMANSLDGYSPKFIMCNGNGQRVVNKTILGGSTPTTYLQAALSGQAEIIAGKRVIGIYNPITSSAVNLIINPYMPDGQFLIGTDEIPTVVPSPSSVPFFFRPRRDYWAEIWPRTTRKTVGSVTIDGAFCMRWFDGFGLVKNVTV
jgi:hypothetical protein